MFKNVKEHFIMRLKINIFNYFMMALDTGYLLLVAMEVSRFVIV